MIARAAAIALFVVLALTRVAAAQDDVDAEPLDEAAELEAAEAATGTARELGTPLPPPGYTLDPSRVHVDASEPIDEDAQRLTRLDAVLASHARGALGARIEGGILSLASGLAIVGTGIALIALEDGRDPLFFILGGLSMALGLGTATTGAISLAMTTSPERRYAAFQRDRASGALTARRVGRYEGALWAEAESAADVRMLGIAGAVLLAANGIVEVAFTAQFAPDDTFRALGYGLGAVYVALGVLELVLSFEESDAERRFREYEEAAPTIAVRPWASPTGAGVVAAGTF
jgi:hypothetical protein